MAPTQPLDLGTHLVVSAEPSAEPGSSASENATPGPQTFTRMRGPGGSSNNAPSHGSRTITIAPAPAQEVPGVLRLRASSIEHERVDNDDSTGGRRVPRVQWTEDTVDNEGMNKKKSKVCCIFRKQRRFGESDSEESDGSCCSDSDSPNEYERVPKKRGKQKRQEKGDCCSHKHGS